MLSVLGFLAILGPLVIVHEFGHYLFARLFNVKAEVFSIGFGPRIWSKKRGETEWKISAIPLGGYVKLLGEDPDAELSAADLGRSLSKQAPWKRFFIFFGGPLFNFLFAILVFMAILVLGEEHIASYAGRVVKNSAAQKIGFKDGDKILTVDGQSVLKFEDVLGKIAENPGREIAFEIERARTGEKTQLKATPSPQEGLSVYGEATHVGEIEGLMSTGRSTQLGVSNPDSLAGKLGLHTGDKVSQVAGAKVESWESLDGIYDFMKAGETIAFTVEPKKGESKEVRMKIPSPKPASLAEAFGLYSSELFVEKVMEGSPAEKSGLQKGDRLVSVSGKKVESFFGLKDAVQRAGESQGKVVVEWERAGKLMKAEMVPNATTQRDALLKKVTLYTVGVVPMLSWSDPLTVSEKMYNPFKLLYFGTGKMLSFTFRNVVSLGKMFTGDVSLATLGGPILIGKLAGESLSKGLVSFLTMMAILSIGLGVLNLMPVPVLDGGHLLLLGIETVRGRPLSLRQMEIVQQVGLSLILLLMFVVMKNDFTRLSIFQ